MSKQWVQFDYWLAGYLVSRQTRKDRHSYAEVENAYDRKGKR